MLVEKIKELKKKSGLTTAELSEKSGIPIGTLNKILSASTKSVKSETLNALANALGVSIYTLMDEKQESENVLSENLGYIRVAALTPNIKIGDMSETVKAVKTKIAEANGLNAQVAVFPELTLSGYTLSDLFYQDLLLKNCEKSLIEIRDFSANYEMLIFVGCPLKKNGKLYNTAVAIFKGEILGVVPKTFIPNYNEFYERRQFSPAEELNGEILIGGKNYPFGSKLLFVNEKYPSFSVAAEICEDLWAVDSPSLKHTVNGANIIVNLSASDELIGKSDYRRDLVKMQSAKCVCAYAYSDAGTYESSTDMVFAAHNLITENGKLLSESELFKNGYAVADIDVSFIESEKHKLQNYEFKKDEYQTIYFQSDKFSDGSLRKYEKTPFVPTSKDELDDRINLILNIQSQGLMRRVSHINAKSLVIGVSGGLDSTLALLVACRAIDGLNRSRKDIIAVTMPCFGTTNRTKNNSVVLSEYLGVTLKEINITDSVLSHFKDIGQDVNNTDVTYENGQARERTQVLMDIANQTSGIVIGTGDLSELALGWATYNGDHMSMYGVNSSIPKTLVRHIIDYIAKSEGGKLEKILEDILDTPVSPELLPTNSVGEMTQKTEDIVGPYVLHDFFLYHFIRSGFSPSKIYIIAVKTFKDEYDKEFIYKWLNTFIRRFFAQQFKRSCLPDGVKVGSVSLSPRGDWRMPSDVSAEMWLEDLKSAYKRV